MTIRMRHALVCMTALAGAVVSAAPAGEKAPPARKKLTYKVKQSPEFIALAEKARGLQGVYAKGTMEMKGPKDIPPERQRRTFETWTTPTAARAVTASEGRTQTIVYDGKYAYSFRKRSGSEGQGSRRKVTEERYYDHLEVASPSCDAARGYTNLGNVATFRPIPPDEEYGKKVPGLKWFQVVRAKTPPEHTFVREMDTLKFGLSTADGLIRVILAEQSRPSGPDGKVSRVQMVFLFSQVRHQAIKAGDVKLPPEAAKAEWRDRDGGEKGGKKMEPPLAVIATEKKEK